MGVGVVDLVADTLGQGVSRLVPILGQFAAQPVDDEPGRTSDGDINDCVEIFAVESGHASQEQIGNM